MSKNLSVSLRSVGSETFKVVDTMRSTAGFGTSIYELTPSKENQWLLSALTDAPKASMSIPAKGTLEIKFTIPATQISFIAKDETAEVLATASFKEPSWVQEFFKSGSMTGFRMNSVDSGVCFYAKVKYTVVNVENEGWLPSDR